MNNTIMDVTITALFFSIVMFSAASTWKSAWDKKNRFIHIILIIFILAVIGLQIFKIFVYPSWIDGIILGLIILSTFWGYRNGSSFCPQI